MNWQNEKKDMRSVKTQNRLREALSELMYKKPASKITVSELVAKAGISRGTFYLYYDNITAMVHSIKEEMLFDYVEHVEAMIAGCTNAKDLLWKLIRFSFDNTADNLPFSKLLYSTEDSEFLRQYASIIFSEVEKQYPGKLNEEEATLVKFYIFGTISIIQDWIINDMPLTAEKMTQSVYNIILNGGNPFSIGTK